jgi:lipoprotein-releasing system permease protein
VQCDGFVEGSVFLGVDNENLGRYVVEGRLCKKDDEVIVGKKLFDKLRVKMGEDVVVMSLEDGNKFLRYKIVGVYETGIDELDDKVSLCCLGGLQKINFGELNLCDGVNISFDGDYGELREVAKEYCGRLSSVDGEYVYVNDWLKNLEQNSVLYIMIIFFTILTNVICILILQLFENKELIDRLLFMGTTLSQVENLFVLRNVQIVLRSMVSGSVLAFLFGFVQMKYRVLGLEASDYYLSYVPVYFDMKIFVFVFFVMISVVMGELRVVFNMIKKK